MNQNRLRNNPLLVFAVVSLVLFAVGFLLFGRGAGSGAVNPYKDKQRQGDSGKTFAALYKHGELYKAIGENDDVLREVQEDILLFARTTRVEFNNPDKLVGFTVSKQLPKEAETSVFMGRFYGLSDEIRVAVTPHGRGVYTLSITNQADQTNIDEFLGLNGARNRYIATLPIQKGRYSIRYQLVEDRIVATFYDGYTNQDIDEVEKSLQEGLKEDYPNKVVFSINRIGIFPLEVVRQNLITPLRNP